MRNLFLILIPFLLALHPVENGLTIGQKAGPFSLKSTTGEMVSLYDDYKGEDGVIVIFTCNTCPFAVKYEDRIIALHEKFSTQGYPVIAINPNDVNRKPGDSFEEMIKRAKEKAFPFPYLYDETQEVAAAWGATKTPHVYVLKNEGGNFICQYIGAIDDNTDDPEAVTQYYVEDAIAALAQNRRPDPNFTKAIGCTIKWKQM